MRENVSFRVTRYKYQFAVITESDNGHERKVVNNIHSKNPNKLIMRIKSPQRA